ncbi:hypothetical protein NE237_010631 [Protea cynaroides]|uniref:Uncharacterized protein n=1 Tax=Protea cynaroides TaxID=273540 RepID=A0A9Q0L100_9MAGN|nr:hypothetical protein NE237_010631 [Protea cynaroides]
MMSRRMVLVFLLLILLITSQFEWKQQLVNDLDISSSIYEKLQQASKGKQVVKEKIILSQEKNIQRLKELVWTLREQLQQCRGNNDIVKSTVIVSENVNEPKRQHILED